MTKAENEGVQFSERASPKVNYKRQVEILTASTFQATQVEQQKLHRDKKTCNEIFSVRPA